MVASERKPLLTYKGVKVYHVYKDNDLSQGPRFFWFTTNPALGDEDPGKFDVRELPTYHGSSWPSGPVADNLLDERMAAMLKAVDAGILTPQGVRHSPGEQSCPMCRGS